MSETLLSLIAWGTDMFLNNIVDIKILTKLRVLMLHDYLLIGSKIEVFIPIETYIFSGISIEIKLPSQFLQTRRAVLYCRHILSEHEYDDDIKKAAQFRINSL